VTKVPGSIGEVPVGKGHQAGVREPRRPETHLKMKEVGLMETTVRTPIEMPDVERLEPIHTKGLQRVFAVLRLAMGWTFLWAFLDKAFALGSPPGGPWMTLAPP